MSTTENKNRRTGLIVSVTFHTLLLLVFAFFGLTYLDPPPEPEGIAITFGISNDGMLQNETNTPSEQTDNVVNEADVPEPQPDPVETVEEDILTQTTEEAPSIDKKEKEEKKEEPVEKKEEPKPDKNLTNALDKWKNKKTEEGGGKGITGKPGDQGSLNGDPNSNSYVGSGGNGTTFSLSGRSMLTSPKITDNSQEEGEVVVDIIVDKYGRVLRATPGARGSTTTSSLLYKKAREAALQTKFNANPDAAEEQKGSITFIFILN